MKKYKTKTLSHKRQFVGMSNSQPIHNNIQTMKSLYYFIMDYGCLTI